MPYAITAVAKGKALRQTRGWPASAAVLAMRWVDDGHAEVRIIADGRAFSLASFRSEMGRMKQRWNKRSVAASESTAMLASPYP